MSKKFYELSANDEVTIPTDLSGKQDVLEYDASPTQNSTKMVKSGGIFTWVKGLLPNWLTSSYAEPATVASVNAKYTKPSGGIPSTDLASGVVSNATITLTQGGVTKGSFTLNQASGKNIALDAGGSGGGGYPLTIHLSTMGSSSFTKRNVVLSNGNIETVPLSIIKSYSDVVSIDLEWDGSMYEFAFNSDISFPMGGTSYNGFATSNGIIVPLRNSPDEFNWEYYHSMTGSLAFGGFLQITLKKGAW